MTPKGKKDYVVPRELTIAEIKALPQSYAGASKRAIKAGFDGVEIHAANGYLLDQFIRDGSNNRMDEYGGNIDNRVRLLIEVATAVRDAVGADKVGVRLSPRAGNNSMHDSDAVATFSHAAKLLNDAGIVYLHIVEGLPGHRMAGEGERVTPHIRKVFTRTLIANGGYTAPIANATLDNNEADAVSFGITFLANPDLVERLRHGYPLNAANTQTLYLHGREGYTDYPFHKELSA